MVYPNATLEYHDPTPSKPPHAEHISVKSMPCHAMPLLHHAMQCKPTTPPNHPRFIPGSPVTTSYPATAHSLPPPHIQRRNPRWRLRPRPPLQRLYRILILRIPIRMRIPTGPQRPLHRHRQLLHLNRTTRRTLRRRHKVPKRHVDTRRRGRSLGDGGDIEICGAGAAALAEG